MKPLAWTSLLCAFAACDPGDTGETLSAPDLGGVPVECQIQSVAQHSPGWPYDLPTFKNNVLPILTGTCNKCHTAPTGKGGFNVWVDAAPGNCSYAKTFNAFIAQTDLANPTNSRAYVNPSGGNPKHGLNLGPDDPKVKAILAFIENAAATYNGTPVNPSPSTPPNNSPPPPAANPFDYAVFQSAIMPILDTAEAKGCTASACHGSATGQGGFKLVRLPLTNTQDMEANFAAVTARADLITPESSVIYLRATTRHASGASAVVTPAEAKTILDWITLAKAAAPPSGTGAPGGNQCPSPDNFNLGVFRDEIQPVLFGTVDLNNPNDTRVTTGCARGTCHGADRTGGALVLKTTNTVEQNLANFACFVNLNSPTASEVLLCPLNTAGCRKSPHPGQTVFSGVADLNYQKVLSYLYAAKTVATPLDFAFFVRRVNPIFNDANSVPGGLTTCAGGTCHGVSVVGAAPGNGSNFPLIANAADKERLGFNFASAANFTNFVNARGSSLFLFPTNEIANLANPFATGLPHPGGLDFAPDSLEARDILRWSGGLRPDGTGQQGNWLVAGDYAALAITDPTIIDEARVTPRIFDRDGAAQFNAGQWDGLFSDDGKVDLGAAFPRALETGRVAYAVAYLINATTLDLSAQLTIISPNAVKVYAGAQALAQTDDASAGLTALTTLAAYATTRSSTRVLVKVLQHQNDRDFQFRMLLADALGNPLTDATGEIIVKLAPDGGI